LAGQAMARFLIAPIRVVRQRQLTFLLAVLLPAGRKG